MKENNGFGTFLNNRLLLLGYTQVVEKDYKVKESSTKVFAYRSVKMRICWERRVNRNEKYSGYVL